MKTLWIGCSHSAGVYNEKDQMTSDRGLPHLVGKNYGLYNWKAISAPGFGILEFNNILEYLDQNELLNFDNLILQLTNEPRLVTLNIPGEALKFEAVKNYLNSDIYDRRSFVYRYDDDYTHPKEFEVVFNRHPSMLYRKYQKNFSNSKDKTALLNMCEEIAHSLSKNLKPLVRTCFKNITEITERRGINLYTFCWSGISTYEILGDNSYQKYDIFNGEPIIGRFERLSVSENTHVGDTFHPLQFGVDIGSKLITESLDRRGFS